MLSLSTASPGDRARDHRSTEYRGRLDVVPFEAWHIGYFSFRPEQAAVAVAVTQQYAQALEQAGHCFSAWAGSRVVISAGVIHFWPGRAQVWAMVSEHIHQYGGLVHRRVLRYIEQQAVRRLECVVDPEFTQSVEWAKRLGFSYESTMAGYGIQGQAMDMYVRVR